MIEEIVNKISSASKLEKGEVLRLIEDKQVELSGLISEEGAAYLVAKELGVHLKRESEKLNIGNVMPGMMNVGLTGKITRVSPVREFKTERAEGRVCNVTISDSTGSINLSLWNDEINKLDGVQLGDTVDVHGFVKEGYQGGSELRLGRTGSITKSEEQIEDFVIPARVSERGQIKDLRENMYRSVRSPVMQIFEGNVFYEICPDCKKRMKEEAEGFVCAEHGMKEPAYGMILTGIIDDGTANMRAVFFGEAAESLIGMSTHDAKKLFDRKKKVDAVIALVPIGKEFILDGKVRHNAFFDRMEFAVNSVKSVDVKKEIEMMMEKM